MNLGLSSGRSLRGGRLLALAFGTILFAHLPLSGQVGPSVSGDTGDAGSGAASSGAAGSGAADAKVDEGFASVFAPNWQKAVAYLDREGPRVSAELRAYGLEPETYLAVVFPEILRADYLRDRIETAGLMLMYVEYGPNYADFSVGPFQMKPSFVEKVERDIFALDGAPAGLVAQLAIPAAGEVSRRRARVERLGDPIWQARYLAAFAWICQSRFADDLARLPAVEKVLFLATAYNAGYDHEASYLWEVSRLAFYPDRYFWPGGLYRYAEVSRSFFEKELPRHPEMAARLALAH